MTKYFKNVKSLEDLKNQFKALARKNHPDAGGNADTMKEINCEYDALFQSGRIAITSKSRRARPRKPPTVPAANSIQNGAGKVAATIPT